MRTMMEFMEVVHRELLKIALPTAILITQNTKITLAPYEIRTNLTKFLQMLKITIPTQPKTLAMTTKTKAMRPVILVGVTIQELLM